ncbi:MAG TPA: amidase [Vicinamibacterales bacterium]|nr:amidase [Vicinamibacterales bacterium]
MRRRTFLTTVAACVTAPALTARRAAGPTRLETFLDWQHASREARERALAPAVDRIRELDARIHAWVQVAPEQAAGSGALASIPFGVKDIIETKGLATEYGSPIYKGRIGTTDAAIVRDLRVRGGVVMGKTQTTSFAYRTPAPTRNPRDLAHTPGGSSSGSAAAVAAGMIPFALGTQTGGSVLRPASFCGVAGFKPSYGLLPMEGVLPFAKSLDTLGLFTQTAADMSALWEAMGHQTGHAEQFLIAAPDPLPRVEPPMAAAFARTVARLRKAGVAIQSIDIATMLEALVAANRTIMFYEGARFHEQRYKQYGERLADMAALVREGLQIPVETYDQTRRLVDASRTRIAEIYKATPVILVPAATGPAPLGLESTGDSSMNASWTTLGVPAMTIPMPVPRGLPLGLQLTADHGEEARVLRTAARLETLLHGTAD